MAFTLAEVLITLGIIGVVAAMTIPTLMTKIHRQQAETKLKKFNSVINQALRHTIAEYDDVPFMDTSDVVDNHNGQKIYDWYNEYLVKYLSGASMKQETVGNMEGVKVTMKDGTGFTSYMQKGDTIIHLWVFYCMDASHKSCKVNEYDGKNTFLFLYDSNKKIISPAHMDRTIEQAKANCMNSNKIYRHSCAAWIAKNGWKIPDDYPWIK